MMKRRWAFILCFLLSAALSGAADAGDKAKAVMMPVSGALSPKHKALIASKVASAVGKAYQVQWGDAVNKEVLRVFAENSNSADCDLEPCYRKIAALYKVEEVIGVIVLGDMGGEMSVTVRGVNVMENRETFSTVVACPECTAERLSAALERLSIKPGSGR